MGSQKAMSILKARWFVRPSIWPSWRAPVQRTPIDHSPTWVCQTDAGRVSAPGLSGLGRKVQVTNALGLQPNDRQAMEIASPIQPRKNKEEP